MTNSARLNEQMFVVTVRRRRRGCQISGANVMEGAASRSCDGAASVRRKGAATARRQISNPFEGAAPPKFDKKFQISMGSCKRNLTK